LRKQVKELQERLQAYEQTAKGELLIKEEIERRNKTYIDKLLNELRIANKILKNPKLIEAAHKEMSYYKVGYTRVETQDLLKSDDVDRAEKMLLYDKPRTANVSPKGVLRAPKIN